MSQSGQVLDTVPNGVGVDTSPVPLTLDNVNAIDLKLELSYPEQESDVRNDPLPLQLDVFEDASTRPQVGTPVNPASIAIRPPKGTPPPATGELLEDVKMAERADEGVADVQMTDEPITNGHVNGHSEQLSVSVSTVSPTATRMSTPLPESGSSSTAVNSNSSFDASAHALETEGGDDQLPPAKRARKFSDADQASLNHTATPPPASTSTAYTNGTTPRLPTPSPAPPPEQASVAGPSKFSLPQHRFCTSTVRTLRKLKDASPFLHPVDAVALGIPHYPSIIKHPMDFSTIERKLQASNPVKPDPNPANPRYHDADAFVADVRLIFQNAITFNGPEHLVSQMGKRVEIVFDKQIKQMPPAAEESKPPVIKKPSPPPPPPKKLQPTRRSSTSVPTIRRSEAESIGRPKREIHPPPPKDLPYADPPKKVRKGKVKKDNGTAEQLRFCGKLLSDLHKKQYWAMANPFYEPVDWVKLDLPSYPKVIKKPMDLSTMRKKLDNQEYRNADKFREDFGLMIRNCFMFNPAGTPVNQAGIELQRLFEEKWRSLPALHDISDDDDDDDDDETDDEQARTIAFMESQIETMRGSIAALKGKKDNKKERKEKKKKDKYAAPPVASSSKASNKAKQPSSSGKKKGKKPVADDDVLSFEQKKDLSETIQTLDGAKLEKVINIIHEGVPEIRDSTEEIELDIDSLPAMVLTKLYNFVLRPLRPTATKRTRPGPGTGGLKRKSMDEDVEAEKIRQLEERMRLFEGNGKGTLPPGGTKLRDHDSVHSSDSSSGSDSSGSDSE